MKDWQQRVIDEQAELDARGSALCEFIEEEGGTFDSLPKLEQTMLCIQLGHMQGYLEALEVRIEGFEQDENSNS